MSAETIVRDIFGDSDDSEDDFEVFSLLVIYFIL